MTAKPDARHTEVERVEQPFIAQLKGMGWSYLEGDTGVPYLTERPDFKAVLLRERLGKALKKLTPWLDDARVEQAIIGLERVNAPRLLEANATAHHLLVNGFTVSGLPDLHRGRNVTIPYIDFDHPENNDFLAINQFRVDPPYATGDRHYIVPDIVLFVNGIPLVVIECKSPYINEPMDQAIDQLRRYSNQRGSEQSEGAERLFYTNAFMVATHYDGARVAAVGGSARDYLEWKDAHPQTDAELAASIGTEVRKLTPQHRLVAGMLRPETLLDLIANFILFKADGGTQRKVVARYQQFRAVQHAVGRLQHGQTRPSGAEVDERGGVIWHTQGSGKSLTMVFLVRKMRRLAALRGFKVVVVTDRKDLQKQLSETATLTGDVLTIARNADELKREISRPGADLIFGMIQKYRPDEGSDADQEGEFTSGDGSFPELNASDAVLVLVDEAHRSHNSSSRKGTSLHMNLREALPNAAMIGFTGTPILTDARRTTTRIFGPYIDTYTILQSVQDGATVPIRYEGRTVRGKVRDADGLNRTFEDLFADYTDAERGAIKRKYAASSEVFESEALIKAKARDALHHYVRVALPNGTKAMIVAGSRRAAVRYQSALVEAHTALVNDLKTLSADFIGLDSDTLATRDERTQLLVEVYPNRDLIERLQFAAVISGTHNDLAEYGQWSDPAKIDTNIENFKKALVHSDPALQSPLAILCVKSMLITGFDAPVAQVLYLDRSIRDHELLQAMARVNRLYKGKDFGLVVDYYGVTNHLQEALALYNGDTMPEAMSALTELNDLLPALRDHHRDVLAVFTDRGISSLADEDGCLTVLEDARTRAMFTVQLREFLDTLDALMPRPEARPFLGDAKQLGLIAQRARNRFRDATLNLSDARGKVRQLIDTYVIEHGVDPTIPPVDVMDVAAFREVVGDAPTPRAKAAEMTHAARHHIQQRSQEDPIYYNRLSDQLDAILNQFRDDWIALESALADFITTLQHGQTADNTGLDPLKQAPFMRIIASISFGDNTIPEEARQPLIELTVNAVRKIQQRIGLIDFWRRQVAREDLGREIYEQLNEYDIVPRERRDELADILVELAHQNHILLTA